MNRETIKIRKIIIATVLFVIIIRLLLYLGLDIDWILPLPTVIIYLLMMYYLVWKKSII